MTAPATTPTTGWDEFRLRDPEIVPTAAPWAGRAGRAGCDEHDERGALSVIMVGVLVVGLVLALGAARLGAVLVARARAETAADAAALAAADALALGRGTPRAAADDAAARNEAVLLDCDCSGTHAQVRVAVRVRGFAGAGRVTAQARAELRPECVLACRDTG